MCSMPPHLPYPGERRRSRRKKNFRRKTRNQIVKTTIDGERIFLNTTIDGERIFSLTLCQSLINTGPDVLFTKSSPYLTLGCPLQSYPMLHPRSLGPHSARSRSIWNGGIVLEGTRIQMHSYVWGTWRSTMAYLAYMRATGVCPSGFPAWYYSR